MIGVIRFLYPPNIFNSLKERKIFVLETLSNSEEKSLSR